MVCKGDGTYDKGWGEGDQGSGMVEKMDDLWTVDLEGGQDVNEAALSRACFPCSGVHVHVLHALHAHPEAYT